MLSIDAKPFEVWHGDVPAPDEWVIVEVDRSGETDEITTVESFEDEDEAYAACAAWNAENACTYEKYLCVVEQVHRSNKRTTVWLEVQEGRTALEAAEELSYEVAMNDPTTFGFGEFYVVILGAVPVWKADALLGIDPEVDLLVEKDAMDTIRAYNRDNP